MLSFCLKKLDVVGFTSSCIFALELVYWSRDFFTECFSSARLTNLFYFNGQNWVSGYGVLVFLG